jgi:uncharacterized protein with ATP-grasp and redox domains
MTPSSLPCLPLPAPLRGRDIPSFTHTSIVKRLPEIGRRVLHENELLPAADQALRQLLAEIPDGKIRPPEIPLAPDAAAWGEYVRPYLGQDWLSVPWFFAEAYFYARVLETTGYYAPGRGQGKDPFRIQKRLGLQAAHASIVSLTEHLSPRAQAGWDTASLRSLIAIDLWGNLADLSRWPASRDEQSSAAGFQPNPERILVDDSAAAAECLADRAAGHDRVDFLLDNVGFELVCDLFLAAALLHSGMAGQVQLHVKAAPVFVSDATAADVRYTLETLAADANPAVSGLGRGLQSSLENQRLTLREDVYWTSPLPLWEMPADLRQSLGQARVILAKGDANYRRILGDRHWPPTTPFEQVASYLPAPLLALRTLKSEVAIGLAPGQAEAAAQTDPDWMNDGQWGLIQFVR